LLIVLNQQQGLARWEVIVERGVRVMLKM